MQIELNGMPYIVQIRWCAETGGLLAEIVDEAFDFPPRRAPITGVACVARLIRGYVGLAPSAAILDEIARDYAELFQDAALLAMDAGRAAPPLAAAG